MHCNVQKLLISLIQLLFNDSARDDTCKLMPILYIGEIHRHGALFLLLIVWVYRHSRIDGSQECVLPVIRRKCFPADSSLLENTQNHVNVSTTDGTCGPLILSSWHPRMRLKVGGRMIPITGPSLSGPELSGPAF